MKKQKLPNKQKLNRYIGIIIVMLLMFSGILAKLFYLQVVKSEDYRDKATNKSVREIPEFAPRGEILDNAGEKLATSKISYMVVYNETDDTRKAFFSTMTTAYKILDELEKPKDKSVATNATEKDDFELKVNPFRFEFRTEDPDSIKWLDIRFKTDRGFADKAKKNLGYDKKKDILTDAELNNVKKELFNNIKPEEVFNQLVKDYGLYKLLEDNSYTDKQIVEGTNPKEIAKIKENIDFEEKMKGTSSAEIVKLLLKKYKLEELRRFIIIKDTIKMNSFSGYKPVIIASNISKETSVTFLQRLNEMPGVDVNTQPLREYSNGELGSAFLGYISKISSQPEKYEEKGYDTSADYVGASGLEKAFEDRLKGSKGGTIVKLNRQGRVIEELGKRESYPGQNIQLTINKSVQLAAEKALDQTMSELQSQGTTHGDGTNTSNATRGSAVVVDVHTGGIIALASRPGYDPNIFSTPGMLTTDLYKKYFAPDLTTVGGQYINNKGLVKDSFQSTLDTLFKIDTTASQKVKIVRQDYYDVLPKPLYNYATSGLSAAGSSFKPITAIAGLEQGVITADSTITDLGRFKAYNANIDCWIFHEQGGTHGTINVSNALKVSCNYFFYEVSKRLLESGGRSKDAAGEWKFKAEDLLSKYAWKFGLGVDPKGEAKASTGIEIPENFGQTSNIESNSKIVISSRMIDINSIIKNAKLDMVVHETDSDAIKQIKTKFINNCKNQMKNYNNMNFTKDQILLIKELISKTPEYTGKFTSGDINAVMAKIAIAIRDGHSDIVIPTNTFEAAIGQGFSQFTPLQLANYMATIVNGGKRYKLHLVDKFIDPSGSIIEQIKPEIIEDVKLKASTVSTVIDGMRKVTEDGGTTSTAFNNFPISTGGKTGSATFNKKQHDFGRESTGIYVGFAPIENPQIAVCVVISDGAHGGYVAPVARSIYEAYFKKQLLKDYPNYQFVFGFNK